MGLVFKSDFHDEFGSWPLAYIPFGGIDFGDIMGVAQAVGDGDDSAYHYAWDVAAPGGIEQKVGYLSIKPHCRLYKLSKKGFSLHSL